MAEKKLQTTVIIAPHCDDEIIGCSEQLYLNDNVVIIYSDDTPQNRREISMKLKEKIRNVKIQLFQRSIPQPLITKNHHFYIPDPIYEIHPKHREWGFLGEQLARQGIDVTFYNTIMNAPYIHEVKNPEEKKNLLNEVYPDQKSLWEFDHKYYIFEGYNKWIF